MSGAETPSALFLPHRPIRKEARAQAATSPLSPHTLPCVLELHALLWAEAPGKGAATSGKGGVTSPVASRTASAVRVGPGPMWACEARSATPLGESKGSPLSPRPCGGTGPLRVASCGARVCWRDTAECPTMTQTASRAPGGPGHPRLAGATNSLRLSRPKEEARPSLRPSQQRRGREQAGRGLPDPPVVGSG